MENLFRLFEKYFPAIMGFGVVIGVIGAILGIVLTCTVLYMAVNFAMAM